MDRLGEVGSDPKMGFFDQKSTEMADLRNSIGLWCS